MTQRFRTTCPHCASVFRLGSEQLDAASGWVQCGVCGTAFDAYPALVAETPGPAAEPAAPVAAAPAAPPREPETELPSIILIDPDQAAPEEPGPLPEIPPAPPRPFIPVPPRSAPFAEPAARIEYAQPLLPPEAPRRRRPWLAALTSVLLLATLAAQSAYFLRDTLASRLPETRPALEQACAVLGCSLSLPGNLALLQVVGSDLQTEGAGQLRLNLTLGNRAPRAQAWPILVLTLTDQRNQPLARRSFAPSEYLSDTRLAAAGMPPRAEQPLSLALTVRDLAPMGFNLQLRY